MEKEIRQEQGQKPAFEIINEVKKAIIGKDECISKAVAAILAGGHILLNDIPGVGKTTLAMALAKSMSLSQNRVQFTPDVLPSDLTGFSMYQKDSGAFVYQPGSVMCNLLLADEINRTSTVTFRSSMTSSSADCVLGEVRLISSARSRLHITLPG